MYFSNIADNMSSPVDRRWPCHFAQQFRIFEPPLRSFAWIDSGIGLQAAPSGEAGIVSLAFEIVFGSILIALGSLIGPLGDSAGKRRISSVWSASS